MIIKKPIQHAVILDRQGDYGVFDMMSDAIQLACKASEEYSKYSLSTRNDIIDAVINELRKHIEELSSMACKEIGVFQYDDLLYKNIAVLNSLSNNKSIENNFTSNNRDNSYIVNGVIVTPSNPIETIIKYSLITLKSGNSVVFSSNENIKYVFAYAVKLINKAIESVNGPKNLVVTVKEPSIENTDTIIENERITLISEINNYNTEKIAL